MILPFCELAQICIISGLPPEALSCQRRSLKTDGPPYSASKMLAVDQVMTLLISNGPACFTHEVAKNLMKCTLIPLGQEPLMICRFPQYSLIYLAMADLEALSPWYLMWKDVNREPNLVMDSVCLRTFQCSSDI